MRQIIVMSLFLCWTTLVWFTASHYAWMDRTEETVKRLVTCDKVEKVLDEVVFNYSTCVNYLEFYKKSAEGANQLLINSPLPDCADESTTALGSGND